MSVKQRRQQAIARLIGQHPVGNQPRLLELLAHEGVRTTQATVSRDLDELGVIKVRAAGGQTVYALPALEADRIAPSEQLRRVLGEWVADVAVSGNIVVVRTPPGCAHVVASALDRSAIAGLLGTVAGDDTLMCVAAAGTEGGAPRRRPARARRASRAHEGRHEHAVAWALRGRSGGRADGLHVEPALRSAAVA